MAPSLDRESRPGMNRNIRRLLSSQEGGWEVTYTGFILILLCLFVMLSSFATMEESLIFQFVRSFTTAISLYDRGAKFEPGKEVLVPSPDMVGKQDDLAEFIRDLEGNIVGLRLSYGVEVSEEEGMALVRISDNVLFPSGSADLSPGGLELLQGIADLLKETRHNVRIEGHTDNVPIRTARYPSNWELSTARAVNVLRYFSEQEGMPSGRLSAAGFGEFRPVKDNDTEDHRARNRRVELFILPPRSEEKDKQTVSDPLS